MDWMRRWALGFEATLASALHSKESMAFGQEKQFLLYDAGLTNT
jgi:hypothetical protein